jgi:hypothetical protein
LVFSAESEDGNRLRQQLSGLTGHLRVCSLTAEEVCSEVVPSRVLTNDEIAAVCQTIGTKKNPQGLSEFSNETQPRKLLQRKSRGQHELVLTKLSEDVMTLKGEYNITLHTKRESVELLPLTCQASSGDSQETYKVVCTTTITKKGTTCNTGIPLSSDPLITVTFSAQVRRGGEFEIPLAVDGRNVTLQPDTIYTVRIEMNGLHRGHYSRDVSGSYSNDHLTLVMPQYSGGVCLFPSDKLRYRICSNTMPSCVMQCNATML